MVDIPPPTPKAAERLLLAQLGPDPLELGLDIRRHGWLHRKPFQHAFRRIKPRITQEFWLDVGCRGQYWIGILQEIGVCGSHFRLQHVIEELIGPILVFRLVGNDEQVKPELAAFLGNIVNQGSLAILLGSVAGCKYVSGIAPGNTVFPFAIGSWRRRSKIIR